MSQLPPPSKKHKSSIHEKEKDTLLYGCRACLKPFSNPQALESHVKSDEPCTLKQAIARIKALEEETKSLKSRYCIKCEDLHKVKKDLINSENTVRQLKYQAITRKENMKKFSEGVDQLSKKLLVQSEPVEPVEMAAGNLNLQKATEKPPIVEPEKEGKKKFPCHLCDKVITDANNLKKHLALHERKKLIKEGKHIEKLKCDICGKEYLDNKSLQGHKKDVHGEKIKCEHCTSKFAKKSNLATHRKKMH